MGHTFRICEETAREESSVHIEIQVPEQGQQHYSHQNRPDDTQHPKTLANRKLFYRLSSAPRWPMVVHEDGGPKVREVKTKAVVPFRWPTAPGHPVDYLGV